MALDLHKVARQLEGMVDAIAGGRDEQVHKRSRALSLLREHSDNSAVLAEKIAASHTSWLVAGIEEALDQHQSPGQLPASYSVIASDGSQLEMDRHRQANCYLINIGTVRLDYGTNAGAILDNSPQLYSDEADMVLLPPEGSDAHEQLMESTLLGIKRDVEECCKLGELAASLPAGSQTVALLDGSLIRWGLVTRDYAEFVVKLLLVDGYLAALEEMRRLNDKMKLALCSYISYPRSTDVVNALRVALCPHPVADCEKYCKNIKYNQKPCDELSGVRDRDIFEKLLAPGERSALFTSSSSVVRDYYGAHRIYFFYLKLDEEVARIELPEWVARDENLLALAHAAVYEQCRLGQGYPVCLGEAHEQAVVTARDRENFWQLAESYMEEKGISRESSAKSHSKNTRWV